MKTTNLPVAADTRRVARRRLAATALAVITCAAAVPAQAEDALLYVGGSVGQGNVKAGQIDFNKSDFAWKATVGTRPISLLGAELSYVDLGKPAQTVGGTDLGSFDQKASTKGLTGFGLIYLPLPLPLVDVFGKVGLARLQTTASSTFTGCTPAGPGCTAFSLDRKNTQPAYGAGAQVHWGAVAVRVEYEHFQTAGGSPSLLSAGLTYGFL